MQYATVPLGEVMFTPSLPVTVVSVAHLGQTIASGKPLAKLGSGRLSFQATTDVEHGEPAESRRDRTGDL